MFADRSIMLFILLLFTTKIDCVNNDAMHARKGAGIIKELLKDYDRGNVPGRPTIVSLGIYINSFDSISERTMDYSLNIYLREEWYDHRLRFDPFPGENETKLKTEDGSWNQLWVPDVYFRNEKKANFHHITIPNRLLWVFSTGRVYFSSKITVTLSCAMNLKKYPMDKQVCPMEFESFGNTMDFLVYKWRAKPVEKNKLEMPQFRLTSWKLIDCSSNYSSGAFTCLKIDFHLARDLRYYLIQIYIPSVLVIILSWVSFWISMEAIPARVTIGLLTVLTISTQSTGARSSLPPVSYIKAIDIWLSTCLLFVFTSLLEFALVNVFSRHHNRKKRRSAAANENTQNLANATAKIIKGTTGLVQPEERTPPTRSILVNMPEQSINYEVCETVPLNIITHNARDFTMQRNGRRKRRPNHESPCDGRRKSSSMVPLASVEEGSTPAKAKKRKMRNHANTIDQCSRILFPLAFVVFNFIYWTVYLVVYQTDQDRKIADAQASGDIVIGD